MSVGSVDTFSPTYQDFDYDLSAGRLRLETSRFGTPDLVPLGHAAAAAAEASTSESAVAPTVVSLADLSQLRVRPDNIMNIVEEDEDENGDEDTETIKSTSDTEVSVTEIASLCPFLLSFRSIGSLSVSVAHFAIFVGTLQSARRLPAVSSRNTDAG